jgi:hypothetical protein
VEPTDYTHLSWDAFQHARSLALRRMRPDDVQGDPDLTLTPPAGGGTIGTGIPDRGGDADPSSPHG